MVTRISKACERGLLDAVVGIIVALIYIRLMLEAAGTMLRRAGQRGRLALRIARRRASLRQVELLPGPAYVEPARAPVRAD